MRQYRGGKEVVLKKKCASGGTHTYWNCNGSHQHSAGEINILDPDDLVTKEGIQGADSK